MEYPYPGDRSIDYTKQPITITGFINYPEAKVTVNGIEARVEQNGNFSASIQLKEGGNSIQAVAKLGEKEDEITYSVLLSAEGKLNPIPGLGSGGTRYQSRVTFDQSILIKAGETKLIDVTLEVKKDIRGPEAFKYSISNAGVEYGRDQLTMPEGFDASIEPFEFTAYPNTRYDSALTIKTNTQIVPGEYWLRLDWTLENGSRGSGWIEVSVQR